MYPSTAKQRLWLTCLGYDVPDTTAGEEAREMFENAKTSGGYQEPATDKQVRLGSSLGVPISPGDRCHDVAGRLYHLLLLRAWVYSVCRTRIGSKAGRYSELGFSDGPVVAIARDMLIAGMFEQIEDFATTDGRESDVFYRMSKAAQQSPAFAFVVEQLPVATPSTHRPTRSRTMSASGQQAESNSGRGCLLVVVCLIYVAAVWSMLM